MAGSKKCPGCGAHGFRKGTLVYVADSNGTVVRKRVCPKCVGRTVVVLPAQATMCACGKGFAVRCEACVDKVADRTKKGAANATELAEQLLKRASAYQSTGGPLDYADGLQQGMESAARFLQSGRW